MKLIKSLFVLALFSGFSLTCYNCEKDNNSNQFTNKLTLGTGMNGFNLTGEGSVFYQVGGSVMIYFCLESAEDMKGRSVVLDFYTAGGSLVNTITRANPQSYGHILLSSFEWLGEKGNFKVKGSLIDSTGNKLIASKDFTIM